jgi:hypothetical protein
MLSIDKLSCRYLILFEQKALATTLSIFLFKICSFYRELALLAGIA